MPPAGGTLQGVGAGEPVGTQAATAPLRSRFESPSPDAIGPPAAHAIRLEVPDPVALESGRAPRVRKRGGVPDLLMNRLQAPGADRPALLAQLARATQHLMKDDAVHRLCALHDRQPLDVAIPVLPWAIL